MTPNTAPDGPQDGINRFPAPGSPGWTSAPCTGRLWEPAISRHSHRRGEAPRDGWCARCEQDIDRIESDREDRSAW